MAIRHSTAADSSFSPAGKTAWDADHTGDASDLSFAQSGTGAVSRTVQSKERDIVSVFDYLTVAQIADVQAGTAAIDTSAAFTSFYSYLATNGGLGLIPQGTYLLSAQATLTISGTTPSITLFAYGATFTTSGAISAFKITGSDLPQCVTVYGLNVNAVANQTTGFEATGTARLNYVDCTVKGVAASAGYHGFWLHQTNAADASTSCFFTTFERCNVRNNAGNIAHAIKIQGACNATTVRGCTLNPGVGNCITITNESGASDGGNGIVIDGNFLESFTLGISCNVAAAGTTSGLRVTNNRAESGTTFFSMTGSTTSHAVPPWLCGNYMISSVTNYIANINSILINGWDFSITPTLNTGPKLHSPIPVTVRGTDTTQPVFRVQVPGVGEGMQIMLATDPIWEAKYVASGKMLVGPKTGTGTAQHLINIGGESGGSTRSENFSGTATFAGAATVAVSFAGAETNSSYRVTIGGSANETFWITAKGTGGFTINSSNAASTATVEWIIAR